MAHIGMASSEHERCFQLYPHSCRHCPVRMILSPMGVKVISRFADLAVTSKVVDLQDFASVVAPHLQAVPHCHGYRFHPLEYGQAWHALRNYCR